MILSSLCSIGLMRDPDVLAHTSACPGMICRRHFSKPSMTDIRELVKLNSPYPQFFQQKPLVVWYTYAIKDLFDYLIITAWHAIMFIKN